MWEVDEDRDPARAEAGAGRVQGQRHPDGAVTVFPVAAEGEDGARPGQVVRVDGECRDGRRDRCDAGARSGGRAGGDGEGVPAQSDHSQMVYPEGAVDEGQWSAPVDGEG